MATSLVLLGNDGFWATDASLRVWLAYAASEIERDTSLPKWLREIGPRWRAQAESGAMGGVEPDLDALVTDISRPALAGVCRRALDRIRSEIDVGTEYLTGPTVVEDASRGVLSGGCLAEFVYEVGSAFLALIEGRLKTGLQRIPFVPRRGAPA